MKKSGILFIAIISFLLLFNMCEDEEKTITKPSIQFKKGENYTFVNDSARVDDSLKVGIMAESGSSGKLILFEIFRNDESFESIDIDRSTLDADLIIVKDTFSAETWKFLVRDKGNKADSVSLRIFLKDTLSI